MLDANSMDFDDLLMRTVNVLELFEDVRRRYRERFRWILVDEYQDTNHAQYRLLQLLAGEDGNLTVVGDEDQSVYGFRGADMRNILEFEDDFPDAYVVKLEQNYRSTETILVPPTPSSPTTPAGRKASLDGPAARARRSTSPSSRMSTPRRGSSPARSRADRPTRHLAR